MIVMTNLKIDCPIKNCVHHKDRNENAVCIFCVYREEKLEEVGSELNG
jgi:hypothetical protein